jgi:hypothetical protein
MKVGDEVIIRNQLGGHQFFLNEKVRITDDMGDGIFYATNGWFTWAVQIENFDMMILIPKLRAFVVKPINGSCARITDQSNGNNITFFNMLKEDIMNDASMILSKIGINIVSYSSLTKGRGLLLSDDMDTPILNV